MSSRLDNLDETFLKGVVNLVYMPKINFVSLLYTLSCFSLIDLLKDIPAVPTICRTIMSAALSHLDGDGEDFFGLY